MKISEDEGRAKKLLEQLKSLDSEEERQNFLKQAWKDAKKESSQIDRLYLHYNMCGSLESLEEVMANSDPEKYEHK